MDQNAKRFARQILLLHLLLLILVLATVAGAAREIYTRTREQMITQAEDRQKLLAKQTASGIASHYQSILNDLDLMRRADNDETGAEKPTTEPAAEKIVVPPPAPDQPPGRNPRQPGRRTPLLGDWQSLSGAFSSLFAPAGTRSPIIGQVMWRQVSGRVSLLFTMNHPAPNALVTELNPIGSDDERLNKEDIAKRCSAWVETLKTASFSRFDIYNGVGANLICIPMSRGRDLIGVVPIQGIETQFLKPLSEDPANSAWLIDEAGVAMAASRHELVGTTVGNISDPDLRLQAQSNIVRHASGTQLVERNFKIGSATFSPAMITVQPVIVGNKKWELFVTTSLDDVDGVVAKLLHRAMLWCVFVVLSVTAILVSTAVQMIRSRSRMERQRHLSLTRELSQARQIQLAWLPDPHPVSDSVDIAAINNPASHISGDFYNWFELPDGRLVVTVGDVTGHGMSAAFLMATTQLLVRNTMTRLGDPGRCLEEVNRQLCVQVFNGQFVTMVIMILDQKKGRLQIGTAGHPAPLIADGESFQPLPIEPQLVLGVDRETKYFTESYPLPPEASLLLYTDGVVECPDITYARFGDERLRRALYGRYDTAQEMLNNVVTAVDEFRGERTLDDDLTMVAVQLQPVCAGKPSAAAVTV